jgi:hypothetical protein
MTTQPNTAPECKCDLRTKLVGDGCYVCNPRLAELHRKIDESDNESAPDAEREAFEKWLSTQDKYAPPDDFEVWQAAILHARKVPQWISVDERLPKSHWSDSVMTCSETSTVTVRSINTVLSLVKAAKQDGEQCFITHWMPLPAAPLPPNQKDEKK